jgi:hypothetical protein
VQWAQNWDVIVLWGLQRCDVFWLWDVRPFISIFMQRWHSIVRLSCVYLVEQKTRFWIKWQSWTTRSSSSVRTVYRWSSRCRVYSYKWVRRRTSLSSTSRVWSSGWIRSTSKNGIVSRRRMLRMCRRFSFWRASGRTSVGSWSAIRRKSWLVRVRSLSVTLRVFVKGRATLRKRSTRLIRCKHSVMQTWTCAQVS